MTFPYLLAQVNAILCTLVFMGLLWRSVGRWAVTDGVGRALALLLVTLELITALAVARRAALGGDFNEAQLLVTAHALVALAVVVVWPRLARALDVEHEERRLDT